MSSRLIGIAPSCPLRNVRSNERGGHGGGSLQLQALGTYTIVRSRQGLHGWRIAASPLGEQVKMRLLQLEIDPAWRDMLEKH